MKTLALLVFLSTTLPMQQNHFKEIDVINSIMQSSNFSISIEKLDVGYVQNKHVYYVDKASNQVYVTHRTMLSKEQDESLNSAQVKPKVIEDLTQYFIQLKDFEINHKVEHDTLFNRTNIHQFITLQNQTETLLFSDVKSEGFKKIHQIVSANQN